MQPEKARIGRIAPDALERSILKRAHEYWLSKCRGRLMPSRQDIDPSEIKPLLPNIVLSEVLRSANCFGYDLRYRLVGTEADRHVNQRYTGKLMSEIIPVQADSQMWQIGAEVLRMRAPAFYTVPYVGPHRDFLTVKAAFMPLSEDGESVSMLMSVLDFKYR